MKSMALVTRNAMEPARGSRIKIVCLASGEPGPYDGQWLKAYDPSYINPSGYDGGLLETTRDESEAMVFPSALEAMEKWREVAPAPYHVRRDGRPNRPLTAFSVVIE